MLRPLLPRSARSVPDTFSDLKEPHFGQEDQGRGVTTGLEIRSTSSR